MAVAERCARLHHALRRQQQRVRLRDSDLLISTTALEHDIPLVTRNRGDYTDVPRLTIREP